jgi:hypothetical protein
MARLLHDEVGSDRRQKSALVIGQTTFPDRDRGGYHGQALKRDAFHLSIAKIQRPLPVPSSAEFIQKLVNLGAPEFSEMISATKFNDAADQVEIDTREEPMTFKPQGLSPNHNNRRIFGEMMFAELDAGINTDHLAQMQDLSAAAEPN